ncbi:hypothetical protein EVAR_45048_1 [Eumeta japonica]|uniref:Uncharacterized protein n=1 Tax=Eumeta variegata TaxID=151549 RepID=A0A4C1SA21_EUMVA|nr:hypothetical protein EVAR_45048_1 [Eumeta japonica]
MDPTRVGVPVTPCAEGILLGDPPQGKSCTVNILVYCSALSVSQVAVDDMEGVDALSSSASGGFSMTPQTKDFLQCCPFHSLRCAKKRVLWRAPPLERHARSVEGTRSLFLGTISLDCAPGSF